MHSIEYNVLTPSSVRLMKTVIKSVFHVVIDSPSAHPLRQADMLADKLTRECVSSYPLAAHAPNTEVSPFSRVDELQSKIKGLSEGEYAVAKQDVDRLRKELGQPPLPSLQATIEDKSAQ